MVALASAAVRVLQTEGACGHRTAAAGVRVALARHVLCVLVQHDVPQVRGRQFGVLIDPHQGRLSRHILKALADWYEISGAGDGRPPAAIRPGPSKTPEGAPLPHPHINYGRVEGTHDERIIDGHVAHCFHSQ